MDILWILPITAFSNNGKCLAINIFPHPLAYDVKNILRGNPMKEYIEERAVAIANYIIDHNATVRQTAKKFGISKSTVHIVVTK